MTAPHLISSGRSVDSASLDHSATSSTLTQRGAREIFYINKTEYLVTRCCLSSATPLGKVALEMTCDSLGCQGRIRTCKPSLGVDPSREGLGGRRSPVQRFDLFSKAGCLAHLLCGRSFHPNSHLSSAPFEILSIRPRRTPPSTPAPEA